MAAVTMAVLGGVGAAAAIASTAYAIHSGEESKNQAKAQMKKQDEQQRGLEAEAQNKMNEEKALAADEKAQGEARAQQQQARSRQKRFRSTLEGRASTIMTSPLGLQSGGAAGSGEPGAAVQGGGKTLLGQ